LKKSKTNYTKNKKEKMNVFCVLIKNIYTFANPFQEVF
jgi:hypothetical protein